MPRRYVCYGVGGVGGTIAAKLAQSGANVTAIARGEHLEVIQTKGLRLRTQAEDVTLQIAAVGHPSELEPALGGDDVVIISTKAHQALDVLAVIAALSAGDEPTIVCCTNGINTELASLRCESGMPHIPGMRGAPLRDVLTRCCVPAASVSDFPNTIGMLVQLSGTHLVPGEVVCNSHGVHGWLDIGCYPTGSNELCESIAADFRNAQFACEADPQVMMKKRTKLLSNVNNCLAIMGQDEDGAAHKTLNDALIAEAEACYIAANMPYHPRGDSYRSLRVERPDSPRGTYVRVQQLHRIL
jgi:2-dehydropantoate 2-reductase